MSDRKMTFGSRDFSFKESKAQEKEKNLEDNIDLK